MSELADETTLAERDALYLGRAIAISNETRLLGNRPFGAVIVSATGEVLAEGRNSNAETDDCTAHAETEALRFASPKFSREVLEGATMYASGEPCVMCAGAIFWSNIRRVVFGIDAVRLRVFRSSQATAGDLQMSCREVFAASAHSITVIGPALIDAATAVQRAYWKV